MSSYPQYMVQAVELASDGSISRRLDVRGPYEALSPGGAAVDYGDEILAEGPLTGIPAFIRVYQDGAGPDDGDILYFKPRLMPFDAKTHEEVLP